MSAFETSFELAMEAESLVASPVLLKPRPRDASLHEKLSKGNSISTTLTEEWSCDGSSTCRSKSSSVGSCATPGGTKKKSTLKMTILSNKSSSQLVRADLDLESTFRSKGDDGDMNDDSFATRDDAAWWGSNSPVKQTKGEGESTEPLVVSQVTKPKMGNLLISPSLAADVDSNEHNAPTLADNESTPMEGVPLQPRLPKRIDSVYRSVSEGAPKQYNECVRRETSESGPCERPLRTTKASRSDTFEAEDAEVEVKDGGSPTKRKEKKKRTVKRIAVTKVKASELGNLIVADLVNANGEPVSDQKELQDAIRLWKAEQKQKSQVERRSSLSGPVEPSSPRKESTRGRRSSLTGATSDDESRVRSKSKGRPNAKDAPNEAAAPRGRSVSKVRRKTIDAREKSRSRTGTESDDPAPLSPTKTPLSPTKKALSPTKSISSRDEVKGARSRSTTRRAPDHSGDSAGRNFDTRSAAPVGRNMRGRSVGRPSENDGERKRSGSLARGLAKLYNESQGESHNLNKSDPSLVAGNSRSSDKESTGERRRTHSLARGLKKATREETGENRSRPLDTTTRAVIGDDSRSSRRRSQSVGAGLRTDTKATTAATSAAAAQGTPGRRMVARTNSSNVSKRRSASSARRRSED